MLEEIEFESYFEEYSDMFDLMDDELPEDVGLDDYFNKRAFGDISDRYHSPFREWHNEEDVREITRRIM